MRGSVEPVLYPGEWFAVADILEEQAGATVVLPWQGGYRGYPWNERRAMLDPAPRFFAADVLIDDRLDVGDTQLANEDPRLADVTRALGSRDPAAALRELGVTGVLVEKANGVTDSEVPEGTVLHDGRGLMLVDIGAATGSPSYPEPPRTVVLVADGVALLALAVAAAGVIRRPVYGALAHDSGRGST
jgi:hypothetical protein